MANMNVTNQKEQIIEMILNQLLKVEAEAKLEFKKNKQEFGIGYCSIDQLLPTDWAMKISQQFDPKNSAWREMKSFRESKLTSKKYDQFDSILKDITFAIQDDRVLKMIEKITEIKNQIPDDKLYAGGLSLMRYQDFLDPHIDNSHEHTQSLYRRVNLLYYVTPNWNLEDGGHLELWDPEVKQVRVIESRFNRLVLMETHKTSWHSVSPVTKPNGIRCCVSNYYFSSESPDGSQYFHVTSFMARPSQPMKRLLCQVDNLLRSTVRKIKKSGLGQQDLYIKKDQ